MNIKKIGIVAAFMLMLDSIYLTTIGGRLFTPMISQIQSSKFKLNYTGAILAYLLMMLSLYHFILKDHREPIDAFILGFTIYGIFDATNLAIFKNWKPELALIDTLWGGVLFYTLTLIHNKL
mgnify:CR=1 FL=1|tara:strand:- start:217 stop:582 length:366 start_codon:yes stop_codon:yes gene_type:complete